MRPVILALFVASTMAAQTGDWVATLSFGPVRLRLALHLNAASTLDSIDQDAFDLPVKVIRNGAGLRFEAPKPGGRFAGAFSADGNTIAGRWTQRGGDLPVRFERGNFRPQEPRPPYPYDSEEVAIRNGGIRLAGTLTRPRTAGPHPAVVLITGSGPQDRNDTVSGHRPFLVWADFLTRRGFAVLRMDDRGVGGSGGTLLDSTDEDFAGDVAAQVAFLKGRGDIAGGRIGLLGHSEGAAVAAIAAGRSPDVAFLVLLAGPAVGGEQILFAQGERIGRVMGLPDAIAERNREIQRKLFSLVRAGAGKRQLQAELARETARLSPEEAAVVRGQFGRQIDVAASRWFRFVLDFDPRPALQSVRCPALALYGSLDLQVPPDLNAPAMQAALAKGRVATIEGLNHMLQHAQTGSPVEYTQIEETVSPEVLERVGRWLEP